MAAAGSGGYKAGGAAAAPGAAAAGAAAPGGAAGATAPGASASGPTAPGATTPPTGGTPTTPATPKKPWHAGLKSKFMLAGLCFIGGAGATWFGASLYKQHRHGVPFTLSETAVFTTKEAALDVRKLYKLAFGGDSRYDFKIQVPEHVVLKGWDNPKPGSAMNDFKNEFWRQLIVAAHTGNAPTRNVVVKFDALERFLSGEKKAPMLQWVDDSAPLLHGYQPRVVKNVKPAEVKLPAPAAPSGPSI